MSKNTNCLKGWKCPKCGHEDGFTVDAIIHARVFLTDDGTDTKEEKPFQHDHSDNLLLHQGSSRSNRNMAELSWDDEHEVCDWMSGLLSEHPDVIDWAYFQGKETGYVVPERIEIPKDYEEGEFLKYE